MRFARFLVIGLVATFCVIGHALAANCDQFHQYPVFSGDGPKYADVSPIPDPQPSDRPVVQWECFFHNAGHVVHIDARLIGSDGEVVAYILYDVSVDRSYYPGQTAIKLSFQRVKSTASLEKNLRLEYALVFDQPGGPPKIASGTPAIACGASQLCVGIFPNGDLILGNPRNGMQRQGNLFGKASLIPKQFSISCSEAEYCVALDNDGNVFSGAIRDQTGDYFRKR